MKHNSILPSLLSYKRATFEQNNFPLGQQAPLKEDKKIYVTQRNSTLHWCKSIARWWVRSGHFYNRSNGFSDRLSSFESWFDTFGTVRKKEVSAACRSLKQFTDPHWGKYKESNKNQPRWKKTNHKVASTWFSNRQQKI